MLKAIEHEPLFGDRRSKTRWLCFMKGVDWHAGIKESRSYGGAGSEICEI